MRVPELRTPWAPWMYAWTATLLSPLLLACVKAAPQQFSMFLAPAASHSPIEQTAVAWQMAAQVNVALQFKTDDLDTLLAQRVSESHRNIQATWSEAKAVPHNLAVQTFFYESTGPPSSAELALLASSGVKFIRHDFNWVTAEQEPGVYDWSYHDDLVDACESVGIRLFSTIANEENGGRNGHEFGVRQQNYGLQGCNGGCNTWTPESIQAYARFAAAVVRRYAGRGFLFELDDEPLMFWKLPANFTTLQPSNITIGGAPPGYWVACTGSASPPGCPPTAATDPVCGNGFNTTICRYLYDAYIDVALPVFHAMREAGPNEGFCGPSESSLSTSKDPSNFFLRRCADRGLLKYWNAIELHLYRGPWGVSPESALVDIQRARQILAQYPGGSELGIVSGEWGATSNGFGGPGVATYSEQNKAVLLSREFLTCIIANVSLASWFTW